MNFSSLAASRQFQRPRDRSSNGSNVASHFTLLFEIDSGCDFGEKKREREGEREKKLH